MKKFLKNYGFILCMLVGIVAGCIVGAIFPVVKDANGEVVQKGATILEPLGTVFINLMFCVVVPMVFCSIASAIANMESAKKAGKIMGVTLGTFFVTAGIAAIIMYGICRIFPLVQGQYQATEGEVGSGLGLADLIVNFFTKPDFSQSVIKSSLIYGCVHETHINKPSIPIDNIFFISYFLEI